MTSFHSVVVAGLAAFVFSSTASDAQPSRAGRQCEPAVANPSMYRNCHLRIVQGHQICRCAIDQSARYDTTGSIPSQDNWFSALFRGGSDSPGHTGSSSVSSSGSGNPNGIGSSSGGGGAGKPGGIG